MSNEKRPVFLLGKKVNLCVFLRSDVPLVTHWVNDPEVRGFVGMNFPKTEKQEEGWFANLGSDEREVVLGIETKEGKLIGIMSLRKIHWGNRVATTGALIGEKDYWGKGLGTDAKMILLDYAFNTLNLQRICSGVIAYNKRSLQYSLHCGYKIEGTRRKHIYKKGKYWDLVELGLLKEEWLPIWKKYQKTGSVR